MVNEELIKESRTSGPGRYFHGRLRSFGYAWTGVRKFFATEKNAQLHLAAALVTATLSFLLSISSVEVILISLAISSVWVTEMLNTAIEKSMNLVSTDYDPRIKIIKDVAAGAVLVTSVAALIVGSIIFLPKIF